MSAEERAIMPSVKRNSESSWAAYLAHTRAFEVQTKSKMDERPKKPYEVAYHAIQVIYFDNDHVFTGPELARVWSGMRRFGEHHVVGAFWQRKGDNFNLGKEARFALGSLEFIQPMLNGADPIY